MCRQEYKLTCSAAHLDKSLRVFLLVPGVYIKRMYCCYGTLSSHSKHFRYDSQMYEEFQKQFSDLQVVTALSHMHTQGMCTCSFSLFCNRWL